MATPLSLIAKIDIRIAAILDDANMVGDYKIGDKTVSRGSYLKTLNEMRESLMAQAQNEPYESIDPIAYDVDEFGIDESEYVGDST